MKAIKKLWSFKFHHTAYTLSFSPRHRYFLLILRQGVFSQPKPLGFPHLFILTNMLYIRGSVFHITIQSVQWDPHWPQVLNTISTELEISKQIQMLKVKILLFLYCHLFCFFWSNTQCRYLPKEQLLWTSVFCCWTSQKPISKVKWKWNWMHIPRNSITS